ncbi:MAG: hypothetical protein EHM58_17775 [Ignavibacteriae bacterium]|nr:MAG: hypothetical protein EHM58_17775 [Ignavibacteriota bacterium]
MRISTIDIGTNTMLMLIADYDKMTSTILTVKDSQQIPRLGKGVDASKNISQESINKAIEILNEYKQVCTENDVQLMIPFATSFLRDANNKEEFIEKVKEQTDLTIEVLSGETEARWAFWGAVYELIQDENPDENVPKKTKHPIVTIDIGGGSTEITYSRSLPDNFNKQILMSQEIYGKSIDVGSVRIKERYMPTQPVFPDMIQDAEIFINKCFNEIKMDLANAELVGIAGTITTLGAISKGYDIFKSELINGLTLTLEEIDDIFDDLCDKENNAILKMGSYMEGRADIIVPGTLILRTFMKKYGFTKINVSTKGLRYGIFLREAAV